MNFSHLDARILMTELSISQNNERTLSFY